MKCTSCGNEQDVGVYCGQCGGQLVAIESKKSSDLEESNDEISLEENNLSPEGETDEFPPEDQYEQIPEQHDDGDLEQGTVNDIVYQVEGVTEEEMPLSTTEGSSAESVDKMVETSKAFGHFFQQWLKTPSQALKVARQQSIYALINIGLLALLFTFIAYFHSRSTYDTIYSSHGAFALKAFFLIILSIAIVIAVIFLINKLFADAMITFEKVTAIYGGFMTPAIIVGLIALFFSLIKNYEYAGYFTAIFILLIGIFIPLYVVNQFVVRYRKQLDPLYAYLSFLIFTIVALSLVHKVILSSMTGEVTQYIASLFWSLTHFLIGI